MIFRYMESKDVLYYSNRTHNFIWFFIFLVFPNICFAQNQATISGYVYDSQTRESLIGVNIITEGFGGTTTNSYGYYSLTLKGSNYNLNYSYLGFSSEILNVGLKRDTVINIYLHSSDKEIDEVVVTAKSSARRTNEFATINLTPLSISKLPMVFGENDPIKAIQIQTGVKTVGDGTSGFYVQGGNIDQNLILIDEAPIYNPSHLFGLVSVFNPDAVKSIKFLTGNMSAKYGGRLSSVMEVTMNEGNMNSYQVSGGLNILSSRLTLQGPIISDKASFFIGIRRSFVDLLVEPSPGMSVVPQFYDINLKTNYKIGHKNRIYVSFYNGGDKMLTERDFKNIWGNKTLTLRYNHIFSPRIFSNISFIYSDYQNQLDFKELKNQISWNTGIKDYTVKTDFSFYMSSTSRIEFGTNSILHYFTPGESNIDFLQNIDRSQALENSIYVLNDIILFQNLGINYGIRLTTFQNIGNSTWYDYDENFIPFNENINENGVYNTYINIEPRVTLKYFATENITLKTSYAKTSQYVQLLQNNSYGYTSLETWIPASPNVAPQTADIYSFGVDCIESQEYNFSINSYYKKLSNQIDYIDHARLIGVRHIETQIRVGEGDAYGIEVNASKTTGRITGNISYNFSRIIKNIKGINNDKPYPASYDMPNDARVTVNYNLTKRFSINGFWIFSTGRAYTLPSGYFEHDGFYVPLYSDRNAERLPNYHRLDVSFNIEPKGNKRFKSYWKFGIYNIYARQNPLGYNFEYNADFQELRVYQYNFITIMPNISYSFKF